MIDWLVDWLIDWLMDWLIDWWIDWLIKDDAEEGLLFMQEMIDLSKQVQSQDSPPKQVRLQLLEI